MRVVDGAREATFCFVDLAGYTALTEVHGDDEAAELASRFVEIAKASLGPRDRFVKSLGDAVLVACADPEAGLAFLMEMFRRADREQFPDLRAGLHHGSAVEREGDYFGAAVNLAARITALAKAGIVLATDAVAAAAKARGMEVVDRGLYELRNVREPVRLFALRSSEKQQGGPVDPVCKKRVGRTAYAGRLMFEGSEFFFCSLECARAFATEPAKFAGRR